MRPQQPSKCKNLVPGNRKTPFPHCDMRDGREGYCPFAENTYRQVWCRFYQQLCTSPKKKEEVVIEFAAGDTHDAGDILSLLDEVLKMEDYCHRDPFNSTYKVLKPFKVVVKK